MSNPGTAAVSACVEFRVGETRIDLDLDSLHATTVIVGPNGAGKSSLLKSILGILKPLRGRIQIGDEVLFDAERRIDVPVERRRIGYVPQHYALFPHMTVLENVHFGVASTETSKVFELLERLELTGLAKRPARGLSGGELQRVALARALAPNPRLLLLDEPTGALDSAAKKRVRAFLAEVLGELGVPAIVASHQLGDALSFASQLVVLEAGRVVQFGTLEALRASPATPFVEEFVGQESARSR